MTLYPLEVVKKVWETKDSVSLFLSPKPDDYPLFIYRPAQFLTFYLTIQGQSYRRSYSLSSSPLLKESLQTTVKRVKGGVVSNYIVDCVKEGDILQSRIPAGRFFKPPKDLKPKHYFLFAGGSGITPLFSIIKTVLLSDDQNRVTLFYSNRDEDSIIYKKELKTWHARYPNFRLTHCLSQPKKSWCLIRERLNEQHLKIHCVLPEDISSCLFYLCGPNLLMKTVQEFLLKNQVPKEQIKIESFLSANSSLKANRSVLNQSDSKLEKSSSEGLVIEGKEALLEREKNSEFKIKALIDGKHVEISANLDLPILEQLLTAGYSPPFSCLSGSCMSCLALLKKGRIWQQEVGILEKSNIERREILTCQAKLKSNTVEITYDV